MKFVPLGPEMAEMIASHQHVYPEPMREEDPMLWREMLASTPYSIGIVVATSVVGWRVFKREKKGLIYAYDLTVLPQYQKQGLARALVRESLKLPRWHQERVHSHLRYTSYRIVADPKLLWESGYEIVTDVLLPDHYWEEYGHTIHEDAHELLVAPIGLPLTIESSIPAGDADNWYEV